MKRKILLALLVILLIIQFVRPPRNNSNDQTYSMSNSYIVPVDVRDILKVACDDCHTNKTTYPWYFNVQPVAWWLANHVEEGKHHVNFSEFTNQKIAFQNHHFKDLAETVDKKEMPLPSYTWLGLHGAANLTEVQRQTLISWSKAQMDLIKARYPADSLVMPKREGGPREKRPDE